MTLARQDQARALLDLSEHALSEYEELRERAERALRAAIRYVEGANALLDELDAVHSADVVIPFPRMAHTARETVTGRDMGASAVKAAPTVLTGLCGALFAIADRYDPLPPCDVSVDQ